MKTTLNFCIKTGTSIALIALMTSCSFNLNVTPILSSSSPITQIAGHIGAIGDSTFSLQTQGCTTLTLHEVNQVGVPQREILAAPVSNRDYQLTSLTDINLSNQKYLLEVSCTHYKLQRFLTGASEQNINFGSTLASWFPHVETPPALSRVDYSKLTQIYSSLDSETTFDSAFTKLTTLTTLNTRSTLSSRISYQEAIGILPAALNNAAPQILNLTVPSTCNEDTVCTAQGSSFHWLQTYPKGATWKLTHLPSQLSSNLTHPFTPSRNLQGPKKVEFLIGHSDLSPQNEVDISKPYKRFEMDLNIANTYPAVVPTIATNSTTSGGNTVNLVGGRIYTNLANFEFAFDPHETHQTANICETFSDIAITDEAFGSADVAVITAAPAFASSAQTVSCSAPGPTSISHILSNQSRRHYKFWTRDSAGNISATPRKMDITYDITPPVILMTFPHSNSILLQNGTQSFTWTTNETNLDTIEFEFTTDQVTWQTATPGANIAFNSDFTSANWNVINEVVTNGSIRIKGTDLAGNVGYSPAINFSTSTVSTAPVLTLASNQTQITNSLSISVEYDCNGGDDIYISTSNSAPDFAGSTGWMACPGAPAPHAHTIAVSGVDGTKNIYAWTRNAVSLSTGASLNIILDRAAPIVSTFAVNNGNSDTTTNYVDIQILGADLTGATAYCVNSRLSTDPVTTTAACEWQNLAAQTAFNISTTAFLGDNTGTYVIDMWVRDRLLQASAIESSSVLNFTQPGPASLAKVLASTNVNDEFPLALNQQSFASVSNVYLKWNFTPAAGFSQSDYTMKILKSTDGLNFSDCASCITNSCNMSMPSGYTHCYIVESNASPNSLYQYKVEAAFGALKTSASSLPLNITKDPLANTFNHRFSLLAGYYNIGESEFATETIITPNRPEERYERSVVVDSHGVIYILDKVKGLIKYNPDSGAVTTLIKVGPDAVDGLISDSNTTITEHVAIYLDHQDNLYIWDRNLIRYLDFSTQSLTTIIGRDGNVWDPSIVLPRQTNNLQTFALPGVATTERHNAYLWPLPNGDLLFRSWHFTYYNPEAQGSRYYAYYSKSSGTITEYAISGNVTINGNTFNVTSNSVAVRDVLIKIDPTTSNITEFIAWFKCNDNSCDNNIHEARAPHHITIDRSPGNQIWQIAGPAINIEHSGWSAITNNLYNNNYYRHDYQHLQLWNGSSWDTIIGGTQSGYCDDTVIARNCQVKIKDVYINRLNQIFIWDGARIRRFTDTNSPLITIVGNEVFDTSTGPALAKKIGVLGSMDVHWDAGQNKTLIAYSDRSSNSLKEISFAGEDAPIVTHRAGNGGSSADYLDTTLDTRELAFAQAQENKIHYDSDGQIFAAFGGMQILNNLSHKWEGQLFLPGWPRFELSKTNHIVPFDDPNCDNPLYTNTSCEDTKYSNGNGKTNLDWPFYGYTIPMYLDSEVLVTKTYAYNAPTSPGNNYHGLHLHDRADNWRQYVLMDGYSATNSAATIKISENWFSNEYKIHRDKTSSSDTLYMFDRWHKSNRIYKYPLPVSNPLNMSAALTTNTTDNRSPAGRASFYSVKENAFVTNGGNDDLEYFELPQPDIVSFTVFRMIDTDPVNPDLFIAYCTNVGELWLKNLTTQEAPGNEEKYELSTPNARCSNRNIEYNPGRNSVTFTYTINGVFGIAELQFTGKNP